MSRKQKRRTVAEINSQEGYLAQFVRDRRKKLKYTQQELSERTGTSLNFIKSLELGKKTVRLDKVNQVLAFFGAHLTPQLINEEMKT